MYENLIHDNTLITSNDIFTRKLRERKKIIHSSLGGDGLWSSYVNSSKSYLSMRIMNSEFFHINTFMTTCLSIITYRFGGHSLSYFLTKRRNNHQ